MIKEETHWAILGPYGLYYGTFSTRRSATKHHILAYLNEVPDDEDIPFIWKGHKNAGDRAVKVKISYENRTN